MSLELTPARGRSMNQFNINWLVRVKGVPGDFSPLTFVTWADSLAIALNEIQGTTPGFDFGEILSIHTHTTLEGVTDAQPARNHH